MNLFKWEMILKVVHNQVDPKSAMKDEAKCYTLFIKHLAFFH